ncbi:hypothetical protein B0T25DRAFT_513811 [Lasiosphaeria hispida]|uniref:Uncharacterized protein n=1 Tax=Lasiosphaeria hispida TaxID=260671 RepID=A0AAJ0HWF0_9PEZI|nr:hypothetical protein B0T25DRAFT_513811 [Lasiosphaeria hispida]
MTKYFIAASPKPSIPLPYPLVQGHSYKQEDAAKIAVLEEALKRKDEELAALSPEELDAMKIDSYGDGSGGAEHGEKGSDGSGGSGEGEGGGRGAEGAEQKNEEAKNADKPKKAKKAEKAEKKAKKAEKEKAEKKARKAEKAKKAEKSYQDAKKAEKAQKAKKAKKSKRTDQEKGKTPNPEIMDSIKSGNKSKGLFMSNSRDASNSSDNSTSNSDSDSDSDSTSPSNYNSTDDENGKALYSFPGTTPVKDVKTVGCITFYKGLGAGADTIVAGRGA